VTGETHGGPPDEVLALARERSEAREARDFARADAIRDRIRELGWEVMDGAGGSELRPALGVARRDTGYVRAADLASLLQEPADLAVSLVVVADDHAGDLERFLDGLARSTPVLAWELVIVANAPSYDLPTLLARHPLAITPVLLRSAERLGWADGANLGLRRVRGAVALLLDTSLEPNGEFVTPLLSAFDDPAVGVAGGYGVTSGDLRQFEEAPPGEVDAVEGYCLAVRREVLRDVGLFDHHFRYYRNADLDFSFQVRAAGWKAVRCEPLPLVRHTHRGWTAFPPAERDRLSKRNFYRFLKRWGSRRDLLLHPGNPEAAARGRRRGSG
jgi:GT2 family glycosyltransferase